MPASSLEESVYEIDKDTGTLVEPTCEDDGYTVYICTLCSATLKTDLTEKLGHDLGDWTVVTPATAIAEGKKARICSVCEKVVETRVIPKINAAVVYAEPEKTPIIIGDTVVFCYIVENSRSVESMGFVPMLPASLK